MKCDDSQRSIEKLATGIPGFDLIADFGIPKGRVTLIVGGPGSAKTVFAAQFLAEGAKSAQPGVFITFEETPADIRRNLLGFEWDIQQWEADGSWAFVDGTPEPDQEVLQSGSFDLEALLSRIEHAVGKVQAERVVLDSLGALFAHFADTHQVRRSLLRVFRRFKEMGVTALVASEQHFEEGGFPSFGIEDFLADNVILLRNLLKGAQRHRRIEILKFRGAPHRKGEWPFTIVSGSGINVLPGAGLAVQVGSRPGRTSSGVAALDEMAGGGIFADSVLLVSGATGTGKTLIATHFVSVAEHEEERSILFSYEESREQVIRNAAGWGIDFKSMERNGRLRILSAHPETAGLEDHLMQIQREIEDFQPTRLALDSLSALERLDPDGLREYIAGLTSSLKRAGVTGLFTSTPPALVGTSSAAEAFASSLTDTIILLRYVEVYGEVKRGLTILKMRGSPHDHEIREFKIGPQGMRIGKPFRSVAGILAGRPRQITRDEIERLDELFRD